MENTDDPRLPIFGLQNQEGEFVGLAAGVGISANDMAIYARINPGWGKKDRPATLVSYSEVLFLLAEACQRGILSQNGESYYKNAIKADFDNLGISLTDYNTFIEGPGVIYNNTLARIMEQKWISLFTRGIEAWSEQRRTGFPTLIPVAGGSVNVIPYRFLYPISEEQSNSQNLSAAIETLPKGDALDSKIWWIN